ncbi:MAG: hypothetical protein ACOY0T_18025 [Myxococcota bacterium]
MSSAFDVPDFLDHLAERFGGDRDAALALLANWVTNYEPKKRPAIVFTSSLRQASNPELAASYRAA